MFCIDASVIISAARRGETDSDQSILFLDTIRKERQRVLLPEIAITEVTSGLFRATKDAPFSKMFADALRAVPNVICIAVDRRLTDSAVQIICRTGLRSADALYVALALAYHLTLVTLDREQLTKGKMIVPTRLP
mgnify:CR=1 FL=1